MTGADRSRYSFAAGVLTTAWNTNPTTSRSSAVHAGQYDGIYTTIGQVLRTGCAHDITVRVISVKQRVSVVTADNCSKGTEDTRRGCALVCSHTLNNNKKAHLKNGKQHQSRSLQKQKARGCVHQHESQGERAKIPSAYLP